ncbi:MAG: hypothetical protein M1829_000051 [Trizodia sp. TS-e1964]|nr:MAG: hypothetical protein M1829_000051 [Trizodia sp. TS-e1964]
MLSEAIHLLLPLLALSTVLAAPSAVRREPELEILSEGYALARQAVAAATDLTELQRNIKSAPEKNYAPPYLLLSYGGQTDEKRTGFILAQLPIGERISGMEIAYQYTTTTEGSVRFEYPIAFLVRFMPKLRQLPGLRNEGLVWLRDDFYAVAQQIDLSESGKVYEEVMRRLGELGKEGWSKFSQVK